MRGPGLAEYHLRLARADYYTKGGEPPGVWAGNGAEFLGLKGVVKEAAFRNLLHGLSPNRSKRLVQNAGKENRQCGWDLTFSAPKSVSVLWSQASSDLRRSIEAAHEKAVLSALAQLENEAGLTRRGRGGREVEKAQFILAIFEHGTSRANDPQIHSHALLLNIGIRKDGTTGTLVSQSIFDRKMVTGARYRADLRVQLERIGLLIERKADNFEIKDVPKALCTEFSKRRLEVEAALKKSGYSSPVAAKIATLDTRSTKHHVPREILLAEWKKVGEAHQWSTPQAAALLKSKEKVQFPTQDFGQKSRPIPSTQIVRARQPGHQSVISIQRHQVFPNAPNWSPFRKLSVPYIAVSLRGSRPVYGKLIAEKRLPLVSLQVRSWVLFPNAPKWSPFHGLSTPFLAVKLRKSSDAEREEKTKERILPNLYKRGDRIIISRTEPTLSIQRGENGTVRISDKRGLHLLLDSGKRVHIPLQQFRVVRPVNDRDKTRQEKIEKEKKEELEKKRRLEEERRQQEQSRTHQQSR